MTNPYHGDPGDEHATPAPQPTPPTIAKSPVSAPSAVRHPQNPLEHAHHGDPGDEHPASSVRVMSHL